MGVKDNVVSIFGDKVRRAVERADGFLNHITGMGTARDKSAYTRFQRNRELTSEELDALYSDDAMASRVCDVVPDEELRQGYTIAIDPSEDDAETGPEDAAAIGTAVKAAANNLGLQPKTIEARVWGRAFGGGAILIGAQRELCRGWPNQTEVTVPGLHFIQEDSPHLIGQAVAEFVTRLG